MPETHSRPEPGPMGRENVLLAAARAAARRRWAVHPSRPGDKRPLLKDWPHQATTDVETIRQWWTRWPDANVGLAFSSFAL